jgi:acyl carrier protein
MITQAALLELIRSMLRLKTLGDTAALGKVRGWDSLKHVEIMLALETQLGVKIPAETFGELTSVESIVSYLGEKGLLEAPR